MKFRSVFLLICIMSIFTAVASAQLIPKEYLGKWRLQGTTSKIAGTLEIRPDGTFTYLILPNFKRAGKVVMQKKDGLDLVATGGKVNETFRAIMNVQGNAMKFCIGPGNGVRPEVYRSDSQHSIIYWLGNK